MRPCITNYILHDSYEDALVYNLKDNNMTGITFKWSKSLLPADIKSFKSKMCAYTVSLHNVQNA